MFFLFLLLSLFNYPSMASDALPGCPDKSGNVTIPYPFGTEVGCYYNRSFLITCNTNYNSPKAFITTTNIEIAEISKDGTALINGNITSECHNPPALGVGVKRIETDVTGLPYSFSYTRNKLTALVGVKRIWTDVTGLPYSFSYTRNKLTALVGVKRIWTDITGLPYSFSYTRNKLIALGCNSVAIDYAYDANDYSSGCVSFCSDLSNIVNGSCSGIGCCQTAIPKALQRASGASERFVSIPISLSTSDLTVNLSVGDVAIGSDMCKTVEASGSLVCGENSLCTDSTNGPGYGCSCKSGYDGNPYLSRGCQDIDECEDPATNTCSHTCENIPDSFIFSYEFFSEFSGENIPDSPNGYHGDGKKTGNGCIKKTKRFPLLQVLLGSGLGLLFLSVTGSWIYWGLKKQRIMRLKEKFFKQNGGILLQQQISSQDNSGETARIFTAKELEKATDNYSESRILGRGGNSIVYKGILPDNQVVAIKKSRNVDESQIEQFINEVVILSQVIHRNVVRILGCCLETQVPLLVYEYVSNGTLDYHIHDNDHRSSLSWETRLRVAAETAEALAYLHSATARVIFHRDVKSANILLDNNYMAKLSDFGASRLIPLDRSQITTLVQGTLGYLDPEYFQTGQLTVKSDVYSFGVVLAELLTGEKPLSHTRPEDEQNLASYFLMSVRRNHLFQILEPRVGDEGAREQLLAVAEVTRRCLTLKGDERPTMKEVAAELQRLRRQHGTLGRRRIMGKMKTYWNRWKQRFGGCLV